MGILEERVLNSQYASRAEHVSKSTQPKEENEDPLGNIKRQLDGMKLIPPILMQWQRNQCMGPGLRNLGNTCYLNSVLQCLTYTPPLANFCCNRLHSNICSLVNKDSHSNCSFCLLENRISKSLNTNLPVDAPVKIANRLRVFAKHFIPYRQEDAHEFLRYAIDSCIQSCLQLYKIISQHLPPESTIFENIMPNKSSDQGDQNNEDNQRNQNSRSNQDCQRNQNNQNSQDGQSNQLTVSNSENQLCVEHSLPNGTLSDHPSSENKNIFKRNEAAPSSSSSPSSSSFKECNTVIHEIFGGILKNQVKCLTCGSESIKTDAMMDLSLDVFRIPSLTEALNHFFQVEVLDGDNKYRCEKCKSLSAAEKSMVVLQPPNILVIHFKRFESVLGGKIDRHIIFDEKISLRDYMSKEKKNLNPEYSLYAVIVHSGMSLHSGHYYAYIKDSLGSWWFCNDCSVSRVSLHSVLEEKAYLLFYTRTNSPSSPSVPSSSMPTPGSPPSTAISNQVWSKPTAGVHSVEDKPSNQSFPHSKSNGGKAVESSSYSNLNSKFKSRSRSRSRSRSISPTQPDPDPEAQTRNAVENQVRSQLVSEPRLEIQPQPHSLSQSLSQSLPHLLSQTLPLSQSLSQAHSLPQSLSQSQTLPLSQSLSQTLSQAQSQAQAQLQVRTWSNSHGECQSHSTTMNNTIRVKDGVEECHVAERDLQRLGSQEGGEQTGVLQKDKRKRMRMEGEEEEESHDNAGEKDAKDENYSQMQLSEKKDGGLHGLVHHYTDEGEDEDHDVKLNVHSKVDATEEVKRKLRKVVRDELLRSCWCEKAKSKMKMAKRMNSKSTVDISSDPKSLVLNAIKKEMRNDVPPHLLNQVFQTLRDHFDSFSSWRE